MRPRRARAIAADAIRAAAANTNNPADLVNVALEMLVKESLEDQRPVTSAGDGNEVLEQLVGVRRSHAVIQVMHLVEQVASTRSILIRHILDPAARLQYSHSPKRRRIRRLRSCTESAICHLLEASGGRLPHDGGCAPECWSLRRSGRPAAARPTIAERTPGLGNDHDGRHAALL